jgi:hypothetical protein
MPEPLFESNARATIARVDATFCQRGAEYGDTWRNSQHLMLRAVARRFNITIPESALNAIACAVLVDVKVQRTEGGYKDDTLVDLIAYAAFLAEEMRQFENAAPVIPPVSRLLCAAAALYVAGKWECAGVHPEKAAKLWADLRDAAGFPEGTATKLGVGEAFPITKP